jgi:hypothetical protein
MILEQMEMRLEKWKRFVWICFGASTALILSAAADLVFNPRRAGTDQYVSWLLVWILIQGAAVAPAILLTSGHEWRKVPLSLRYQCIFGSLAASWIVSFSLGLRLRLVIDAPTGDVLLLLLLLGLILAWMYFRLRKELITAPESMFP